MSKPDWENFAKAVLMAQAALEAKLAKVLEERDHWQDVAGREGVCMTCRGPRGAPEPYGCSDCLNTGYCGEWHNEMQELREERERLALAICGGEDAPGYANAQTVETLEKVARDNANATMEQINLTLDAEAKLSRAVDVLSECLERNALLEARLAEAVGHLRKVHDDTFKQAAGHGLMTTDGRSFSCFQINRCQEVAGECERAIAKQGEQP